MAGLPSCGTQRPFPAFALAVILLAGCSPLLGTRDTEPARQYLLEVREPAAAHLVPRGPTLAVEQPRAAPGFDGPAMRYTTVPYRLDQFVQHRWADDPSRMLAPALVAALEGSGRFSSVASADARVRTDYRLQTELLRLVQSFEGDKSTVDLALRFDIIDAEHARLVASEVIAASVPAPEPTPYGGVEGANRALELVLQDLRGFLARHLPPR